MRPNLANNGIASQSTTLDGVDRDADAASYAIDGNFTTDLKRLGRCAKTHNETAQWWQVDLQGIYEIQRVAITSRNIHGESFYLRLAVN